MGASDLRQIMHEGVISVDKDDTIEEAVHTMNLKKVGALLVTKDGEPVGIFTERDVLQKVVLAGLQVKHETVNMVYSPNLVTVDIETTPREVAVKMHEVGFRHLPVMEGGKVVGIISAKDILQAVASGNF